MKRMHLITTGGTIDLGHDSKSGELDMKLPALSSVLRTAGVSDNELNITSFMSKDSLDITDDERTALAQLVAGSPVERFLITHCLNTIKRTAEFIALHVPDKTVVMTGAVVPHMIRHMDTHSMANSDAPFNIGFSYLAAQILPPGVYIAMHGRVLPHAQYELKGNA